jgi:hypothetical protein
MQLVGRFDFEREREREREVRRESVQESECIMVGCQSWRIGECTNLGSMFATDSRCQAGLVEAVLRPDSTPGPTPGVRLQHDRRQASRGVAWKKTKTRYRTISGAEWR